MLDADESHHAMRVRRFRAGDSVRLIDGHGATGGGEIVAGGRGHKITVEIRERCTQPLPSRLIHVAAAVPKGGRQAILFDMLTQLGMSSFTPLRCERSVVRPGTHTPARWRRICLEACKQSGNAYLPTLHDECTPDQAVEFMCARNVKCFIAHPVSPGAPTRYPRARPVGLLIGPEGGFTEAEVHAALGKGAVPVGFGVHTLRIETAAVAWFSALRLNQLDKD